MPRRPLLYTLPSPVEMLKQEASYEDRVEDKDKSNTSHMEWNRIKDSSLSLSGNYKAAAGVEWLDYTIAICWFFSFQFVLFGRAS